MNKPVAGFSKLSKEENKLIAKEYFSTFTSHYIIENYWNSDEKYRNYTMNL
jgi:hypothetical protein